MENSNKKIFENFQDKRLKYYYAQEHTTLYRARDLAIKKTNSEFIAFLDTDDWWNKKKLEKQMAKFTTDSIGVVYSNLYLYYQNNVKKKIFSKKKLYTGFVRDKIITNYKIYLPTVIIRKEAYKKISKGFDDKYNIVGDFDLFVRLSEFWNFACVQEPLAYYRIHDNNFSHKNLNLEIKELENWCNEYISNNFLTNSESKYMLSNINYFKCKKLIFEGKRLQAVLGLFSIKNNSFKIKLLIRILFPTFLIKWAQNNL